MLLLLLLVSNKYVVVVADLAAKMLTEIECSWASQPVNQLDIKCASDEPSQLISSVRKANMAITLRRKETAAAQNNSRQDKTLGSASQQV